MLALIAVGLFGLPLLVAVSRGIGVISFVTFIAVMVLAVLFAAGATVSPGLWLGAAPLWFIALLIACVGKGRRARAEERRHRELLAVTAAARSN